MTELTSKNITIGLLKAIPIINEKNLPKDLIQTLDSMFQGGQKEIDRERLNIIISSWYLPPCSNEFFNYFFHKNITSIEQLIVGLLKLIKLALWHFGDLERAYFQLRDIESIPLYFNKHQFNNEEFKNRLGWDIIKNIPPEDRGYLGYVSGNRPFNDKKNLNAAEKILIELEKSSNGAKKDELAKSILNKLSEADRELKKILDKIKMSEILIDLDLFEYSELEQNKTKIAERLSEIEITIEKVNKLKKIGFENQIHYLKNIEMIDVYIATSMRDDKEYLEMYKFINEVFIDEKLDELKLRYFDPTLCYCESRIDKGIIECLLVRSSKVTIYCAQEGDTFGKDSELAATLAQGKPVIVYVPEGVNLDERANTFKEYHPLGLQIGLYDGVARGVIVVRTAKQCSKVLYKILTNTLNVDVSFEQHGIVLKEKETQSVMRVMTGWGHLAKTFWQNFEKTRKPKSGIPF